MEKAPTSQGSLPSCGNAREWLVFHLHGVEPVKGISAAAALRKCRPPGGYRAALAVLDAATFTTSRNSQPSRSDAPFLAFIGQPAGGAKQ